MPTDSCGLLYERDGDMRACYLPFNHDAPCPEANHAFRTSLTERTRLAQGPWL